MTRNRRYLISAAVLVASVAVAIGVLLMMPPQPGVTKANYDRIKKGMTQAEVEAILGEPFSDVEFVYPNCRLVDWRREDGMNAWILFINGDARTFGLDKSTETLPDKLRRWLHLPK